MPNLIDPIEYGKELEKTIITDGDKRPYRSFRIEPFYGQIATARSVACNLKCAFCWTDPARDEPEENRYEDIKTYSPQEAYDELVRISSNKYGSCQLTEFFRITGCEPTIGITHLLDILRIIEETKRPLKGMLLETNGMILGNDEEVTKRIAEFRERVLVRVSLKAGTPEGLERRTGVQGKFVDLPFEAIKHLEKHRVPYVVATATADAKLVSKTERRKLFKKLVTASRMPPLQLLIRVEEELFDLFGLTRKRLRQAGLLDTETAKGKRLVYERISRSLSRILFPEQERKGIGRMGPEEFEQFSQRLATIDKTTVLQALDEAKFEQFEIEPARREESKDDTTILSE